MTTSVHTDRVRPEWIDYNGHLSEPYYVLVFGDATTALMDRAGLDEHYRSTTGCSLYTVEAHVRYLREVGPDADLEVRTRVLGRDAKRLRLWHELRVTTRSAESGDRLVATEELMCLHVGAQGARPFPDAVAAALDRFADPAAPEPEHAGRSIAPVGDGVVRRPPN
ncbi:thioesterase family protein [Pseudonocardia nantongensis]|uniref:thioesterase family protein n=1 Tax=Pseudonocardia nantongensis TaxID=1181885 RepID=UPI00397B19B7